MHARHGDGRVCGNELHRGCFGDVNPGSRLDHEMRRDGPDEAVGLVPAPCRLQREASQDAPETTVLYG